MHRCTPHRAPGRIRAPDDLAELRGDGLVDPDWARKWPAEQIWRVRKLNL
jgi:hypothetical protein